MCRCSRRGEVLNTTLYTIKIAKVLYQFDEPMLFVGKVGALDSLFLRTDDNEDGAEFISCYLDKRHLEALEDGRLSVRGAFEAQNDIFLLWADRANNVIREDCVTANDVRDKLPERNVGLYSYFGECPDVVEEKGSFLSVYFRGANLSREHIHYSTLMRLLQDVQAVVRSVVLPPQLRGLRSSTVDFLVGDPALGSLMISIKEPTFNLSNINRSRAEKKLTRSEVEAATERSKEEFVNMMSSLVETPRAYLDSLDPETEGELYSTIRSLLPSDDTPFSDVTISTHSGQLTKRVSISKSKAEAVRTTFGDSDGAERRVTGKIVEINAASATVLIRVPMGRVVTCDFTREHFDTLRSDARFRLGGQLQLDGEYWDRVRRGFIAVKAVKFST